MKPLFETDTLVKLDEENHFGHVTGVMSRRDGFYYEVEGIDGLVPEGDISASYKRIENKASGKKKTTRKGKGNGSSKKATSKNSAAKTAEAPATVEESQTPPPANTQPANAPVANNPF